MKLVQAGENGKATTEAFAGINRLPMGSDGEGTEFINLSLDLYPAAATGGIGDSDEEINIKTSAGAEKVTDFTKLQAVADIYDEDGTKYLTGVYDGGFYYRGVKKDYYKLGNEFYIESTDRINIENIGGVYIILAVKENGSSVIWSYAENGTTGDESNGYLVSKVIKHLLPGEHYTRLYLYKENNDPKVSDDYRLVLYRYANSLSSNKVYDGVLEDTELITPYESLKGCRMRLRANYLFAKEYYFETNSNGTASEQKIEGDFYAFDDFDAEHPVYFVVDSAVAGHGTRSYSGRNVYYIQNDAKQINCYGQELNYYYINPNDGKYSNTLNMCQCKTEIRGHFEKWNEELSRYERYEMEDGGTIWRLLWVGSAEDKPQELWHYISGVGSWWSPWNDATAFPGTYTAITVGNVTGIETEAVRISHMTAYKNRIFGVVNDGSMIVCSGLGDYTEFGEFNGVATDSGYFKSLSAGKFTGICEYQGTLIVFKADRMSIYYGDSPSDMVLSHEIKGVGCVDADSVKEVNGRIIFLGTDGFYAYSGGQPQCISRKLAERYSAARAFVIGRKYYAAVDREVLIYDTDTGCWTNSEKAEIKTICDGRLFLADGSIKRVYPHTEWSGKWTYEGMDIFEDMTDDKGINEIYIRAKMSGSMVLSTITDDGEAKVHSEITDDGERMKVWRIPVRFVHGNYYRIKLEGEGSCILYAIERRVYCGGRKR